MAVSTVLHINTADNDGGAARSGYRIHTGLKKLGLQSRMFVRSKGTDDPDVRRTSPLPFLFFIDKAFAKLWTYTGLQYLFFPSSFLILKHPWFREADVIQLYNLHGNFFTPLVLPFIAKKKPLVWRLSDMWPFTGHCAYSYECERWKTGCGACPILSEYPSLLWDTTAVLWKIKKSVYDRSTMTLIAPSKWMAQQVRQSPLLGRFPIHYVPNGIDTTVFHPTDKVQAKKAFGIDPDRTVVLLQDSGKGGERKGIEKLTEIVQKIRERNPNKAAFLVFGAGSDGWKVYGIPHLHTVGVVRGDERLALLYSAADLFVFPTMAENLANVALESMACGTPLITFKAGGLVDLVRDCQNGILVEASRLDQLIEAVHDIIKDQSNLHAMGLEARRTILSGFTQEIESKKVLDIYHEAVRTFERR